MKPSRTHSRTVSAFTPSCAAIWRAVRNGEGGCDECFVFTQATDGCADFGADAVFDLWMRVDFLKKSAHQISPARTIDLPGVFACDFGPWCSAVCRNLRMYLPHVWNEGHLLPLG